jgi:hypothetical protein
MLLREYCVFQEANIEELKIVAERVKKCSSDCRKFNFQDMVNPVLEKENYVSILVSCIFVCRKIFFGENL